jgi:hypothetical protein
MTTNTIYAVLYCTTTPEDRNEETIEAICLTLAAARKCFAKKTKVYKDYYMDDTSYLVIRRFEVDEDGIVIYADDIETEYFIVKN